VGHHDKVEEPGSPMRGGPSADALPGADGAMFLGPRNEPPDQAIREPSDIWGALPSLEFEALIIPSSNEISQCQKLVHTLGNTPPTPLEASTEPLTQLGSDSTSTLADNYAVGSSDTNVYTANGPDSSRKDSTRSIPRNHTPLPLQEGHPMAELPSYAAPDYSTLPIGTEEWPHLPGPSAQHFHGASEPLTPEARTNAPGAAHSAIEAYTSTRRQRTAAKSKRPANSSTACFGYDTPVLMVSQGIAQWEMFYKTEKGVSVVQSLPSGNIMDLTDAITTPIKTLCCFETQKGDNDMVKMGKCTITSLHHILTEEG